MVGMGRLVVWGLVLGVWMGGVVQAQEYPAVIFRNTSDYGAGITRTMDKILRSTPAARESVKIMVYGQSHSKQRWSLQLGQWLRETYPAVDFDFKNTSIGGCASECLLRSSLYEIREFYPDLLIFHVGVMSEWSFDQICEEARTHTACELMLWTDYDPTKPPAGVNIIRATASDLDAELVDAYVQFGEYLSDNPSVSIGDLSDGHLTEYGNWLMCELMKAHFVERAVADPDPHGLVKTYHAGVDFAIDAAELSFRFAGNRIDLVTDPARLTEAVPAAVTIDGAPPSTNPACYVGTRPNGHLGVDWMEPGVDWSNDWPWSCGGLYRVSWDSVPLLETWTATLTNINTGAKSFDFSMSGSMSGPDGSGSNAGPFISNSGRVVIPDPRDWVLPTSDWWLRAYDNSFFVDGYTVSWTIEPRFVDTCRPPASIDPAREHVVTLAQGLSNQDHTLVLTRNGTGVVPVKALRVYRPYYQRSATTVPDPLPLSARFARRYASGVRARGAAPTMVYDMRGKRVRAALDPHHNSVAPGVYIHDRRVIVHDVRW